METHVTLDHAHFAGLPMLPVAALTRGFVLEEEADASLSEQSSIVTASAIAASAITAAAASAKGSHEEYYRQGFSLGELGLMIKYEEGSELISMPPIYRLPNLPAWFKGMTNLHGLLVPVFDLAAFLGIERRSIDKPMLLVLLHGADAAGILIDGLPERLRWGEERRVAAETAPERLMAHVRAACLLKERVWFDIDCASLLEALENAISA